MGSGLLTRPASWDRGPKSFILFLKILRTNFFLGPPGPLSSPPGSVPVCMGCMGLLFDVKVIK